MAMSPFQLGNTVEALLWWALAVALLVATRRWPPHPVRERLIRVLVITLMAFGVSDLVEPRTGAWYSPWWLLVWKSACVVTLVYAGVRLARLRPPPR